MNISETTDIERFFWVNKRNELAALTAGTGVKG